MYKTYSNTWWMDGACTKIQHITDQTHPKFSGPNYHISATDRNLPEVFSGIYRFTYNFKPTFRGGPKKKHACFGDWKEGEPIPPRLFVIITAGFKDCDCYLGEKIQPRFLGR